MKNIINKEQLYKEFLTDIYNAEILFVPALIFFKNQATSKDLQKLLLDQISSSREHIQRLEDIMDDINEATLEEHCRSMCSMIQEARSLVKRCVNLCHLPVTA